MPKSFLKIISLLLIIGLNWAGFSSIGATFAYFNDTEISSVNSLGVGTLDFSLRSGQVSFIPPERALDMQPSDSVTRDIYVKKQGSLPLRYGVHVEPVDGSCDLNFYNVLELRVWYNYYTALPGSSNYHEHRIMSPKYNGLLKDFDITDPEFLIPNSHPHFDNVFYENEEHWLYFQITFPSSYNKDDFLNNSCEFNFVFDGWQDNLAGPFVGFSDTEEVYSTLIDAVFVEEELIDEEEELDSEETVENEDEVTEEEVLEGQEEQDDSSVSEDEPVTDGEDVGDTTEETSETPEQEAEETEEGEETEEVEEDAEDTGEEIVDESASQPAEEVDQSAEEAEGEPEQEPEGQEPSDGGDCPDEGSPAVLPPGDGFNQGGAGESNGGDGDGGDGGGNSGDSGDNPSSDSGEGLGDSGDSGDSGDGGDSGDVGGSVSE